MFVDGTTVQKGSERNLSVDWIYVAHGKVKCGALAKTIMNLAGFMKDGKYVR